MNKKERLEYELSAIGDFRIGKSKSVWDESPDKKQQIFPKFNYEFTSSNRSHYYTLSSALVSRKIVELFNRYWTELPNSCISTKSHENDDLISWSGTEIASLKVRKKLAFLTMVRANSEGRSRMANNGFQYSCQQRASSLGPFRKYPDNNSNNNYLNNNTIHYDNTTDVIFNMKQAIKGLDNLLDQDPLYYSSGKIQYDTISVLPQPPNRPPPPRPLPRTSSFRAKCVVKQQNMNNNMGRTANFPQNQTFSNFNCFGTRDVTNRANSAPPPSQCLPFSR